MSSFPVLLRKEILEQVRTMRLVVAGAVFLVIGLASPLLAKYLPELIGALAGSDFAGIIPPPSTAMAVDQLLKNTSQTGTLAAVLLAMGAVASEKERGTAAFVLTKPASRRAFLLSKFLGIAFTLAVATALAGLAGYLYTALLFEALPPAGFAGMCMLIWISLLVYAAATFLGSTLSRSILPAAGLGIAFLIVLGVLSALPTIGPWTPGSLNGPAAALALGEPPGNLAGPLLTSIAFVALPLFASWAVFRRQEL
jgi:ABC-2 type transport system permease protein